MRFSIKDLLWLTGLVGIAIGWYQDHRAGTIRQDADWESLSTLDCGMQISEQFLTEFQQQLNELESEPSTDDVKQRQSEKTQATHRQ
jgi:hypothetical protein